MINKGIDVSNRLLIRQTFALMTVFTVALTAYAPTSIAVGLCDNAELVQINAVTGAKNLIPGARHFYRVNTPSNGLLTLFTLGATDTTGQLYDKDCLPINGALDFSSGLDSNFLISQSVSTAPYFLEIRGNLNSTQGAYKLQVDGDFAGDDHGVMCNSATVLRSFSEPGVLKPYGDRDFFQVKVQGGTGQLTVFTEGPTDTTGQLYDQNCLLINDAIDFSSGPDNNFQISETLSPGIYYIEVRGNSSTAFGSYNLRLSGNVVFPIGTCAGRQATISGSNGNDVIRGTAGNDVIQAFNGNDVVYGLTGNDIICGGAGDDVLQGLEGTDRLFGEAGDDILKGGINNDALNGGLGSDVCDGGTQIDTSALCEVLNLIP